MNDTVLERIARFSDRRERQILGFDIDECLKRKIPPRKVVSDFPGIPYTLISRDGAIQLKMNRLNVQRFDEIDAYGTTLTYTYYYNYETGRASVYRDGAWDLWVLPSS